MIEGLSGAGKTSLALGLIETARLRGLSCDFVCDDQALLSILHEKLWVKAPDEIAGKIELFGIGIAQIPHIETCKIDLVCKLIDQNQIERFPDPVTEDRLGISIAAINLPHQHEKQSIRIILQKLGYPI